MSAIAEIAAPARRVLPIGRMFVNVPFDYLAIGGGLSLVTVGALAGAGLLRASLAAKLPFAFLILVFNSAHFAASTVRLYSKPGAFRSWPFLTMGLPLASIAVLTAGILWPAQFGWHLFALYVTWSPFHYAAQAFGLACMYHYRSGGTLDSAERRLVYWTCMLPFLRAFVSSSDTGLRWFVPDAALLAHPSVLVGIRDVTTALEVLILVVPPLLAIRLVLRGQGLPLISWLIIVTNSIWWLVFTYLDAFLWATVFHGIQYLAIATIFHAKDRMAVPDDPRGRGYHVLWFYGASLVLGYLLFNVWPYAYVATGFGLAESMLTCTAVINIHHFIVDRYI